MLVRFIAVHTKGRDVKRERRKKHSLEVVESDIRLPSVQSVDGKRQNESDTEGSRDHEVSRTSSEHSRAEGSPSDGVRVEGLSLERKRIAGK